MTSGLKQIVRVSYTRYRSSIWQARLNIRCKDAKEKEGKRQLGAEEGYKKLAAWSLQIDKKVFKSYANYNLSVVNGRWSCYREDDRFERHVITSRNLRPPFI